MKEKKNLIMPKSGIIYGEITFKITLSGMVITILSMIPYLMGINQFVDPNIFQAHLWAGYGVEEIWKAASGHTEVGYWYLHNLNYSDALAMIGVATTCCAAVIGMWGSFGVMLTRKDKNVKGIFVVLAGIVTMILTLSAFGVIKLHH